MSHILKNVDYGFEVNLPEGFVCNEEFYDLLPMGAKTSFCDTIFQRWGSETTIFQCWGFETPSDAQEAMCEVERFIQKEQENE